MRFVFLQQLWFAIIDYFFEGITGYEVWGNVRRKHDYLWTFLLPAIQLNVKRTSKGSPTCLDQMLRESISRARGGRPDVVYMSTTKPTGESVKTLEVTDAIIKLTYPCWMDAVAYLTNLDEPAAMTQFENKNSVQIGDRWQSMSSYMEKPKILDDPSANWAGGALGRIDQMIAQMSQFRLLLESLRIGLESDDDGNSVILHMHRIDCLNVHDVVTQGR
jgi:hypothetical protein